jgi:hypothetical protein
MVLMTSDEWRVQGIEFALSAEGDNTVMYLEKASKCFEFAGDTVLLKRVEAEMSFHTLMSEITPMSTLEDKTEQRAMKALINCVKVGLQSEAKELCKSLLDKMAYKDIFEFEIMNRL